jgi:hypothetical protein
MDSDVFLFGSLVEKSFKCSWRGFKRVMWVEHLESMRVL